MRNLYMQKVVSSVLSIFSHSLGYHASTIILKYHQWIKHQSSSIKIYITKQSVHKTKVLRLRQVLLYVHLYVYVIDFGNRVSRFFEFSLNSLNADEYLTYPP